MGLPGVTFGGLLRSLWLLRGALGVLWGSFGSPRAHLGHHWAPRGRFPGFSGNFWEPFWHDFGYFLHVFLVIFWSLFYDRFLKRFCIDFDVILEAFLRLFFVNFKTSREMLQPTKML